MQHPCSTPRDDRTRPLTLALALGAALGLSLATTPARADVVGPPPSSCPAGHTPSTDHYGPYCRPPLPSSCPAGYVPKVDRATPYCEPPPSKPCPAGSDWTSTSASDAFCMAGRDCRVDDCQPGQRCIPTAFCLAEVCFRCGYTRITGTCRSQADCAEGSECIHGYRCDPPQKRVAPSYQPPATPPSPRTWPSPAAIPANEPPICSFKPCAGGLECLPSELCVIRDRYGQPKADTPVEGSCAGGATCPPGSFCSREFRCFAAAGAGSPDPDPFPGNQPGQQPQPQPKPPPMADEDPLPQPLPPVDLPPSGGCGSCAATGGSAGGWTAWLVALLALWRRRTHPGQRAVKAVARHGEHCGP